MCQKIQPVTDAFLFVNVAARDRVELLAYIRALVEEMVTTKLYIYEIMKKSVNTK